MKKLLILFSLHLLFLSSYSQALFSSNDKPKPKQTALGTPLSFEKIIETDSSLSKDVLFSRTLKWYASAFNDSKAVIEVQDREGGQIIGNGVYKFKQVVTLATAEDIIKFSVETYLKKGKAKIIVSEFESTTFNLITDSEVYKEKGMNKNSYNKLWKETQDYVKLRTGDLIKSFEKYLNTDIDAW